MYNIEISDINDSVRIKIKGITSERNAYLMINDLKNTLFKQHKNYQSLNEILKQNPHYNEIEAYEAQDELKNKLFFHKIIKC